MYFNVKVWPGDSQFVDPQSADWPSCGSRRPRRSPRRPPCSRCPAGSLPGGGGLRLFPRAPSDPPSPPLPLPRTGPRRTVPSHRPAMAQHAVATARHTMQRMSVIKVVYACGECSVQCAVCSVQCAVCSVQCAVCCVLCAVCPCAWAPRVWDSCGDRIAHKWIHMQQALSPTKRVWHLK